MGVMVDGHWQADDGVWASRDGRFYREPARFRCAIGSDRHPAETGRYRLFVSYACPWAHRTLIFRRLKGLEAIIPVTCVHPHMLQQGWEFAPDVEPLHGYRYLHQLYAHARADYSGRVTVPVLWDQVEETIVCNESAEIIRMFNSAFDELTGNRDDYYPRALRAAIDDINAFVYEHINNGVYRCGFATEQAAYEQAFASLFEALDEIERRLVRQRYLLGGRLTEADWRLFTTLVRFDAVYYGHFKCNDRRIVDMPGLWGYLRDLYQYPGIAGTVDLTQIKAHYYYSQSVINPTRIVPQGPRLDFAGPHGRESLGCRDDIRPG